MFWFKNSTRDLLVTKVFPENADCPYSEVFKISVNPQAPVAQKIADQVVFRRFQGEGAGFFFNRRSLTPHQIFDAHLLETTDLSRSRFHFSVSFISRSCFEPDGFIAYSNE